MRLAIALTLLVASLPVVANGQDWDVARMRAMHSAPAPGDARSKQFMQEFGACLAARDKSSTALLGELPESNQSNEILFGLAQMQNGCVEVDNRLRFSPRFLRGPIAEYFFKQRSSGAIEEARAPAVYAAPSNEDLQKLEQDVRSAVIMLEVATCVARANPSGTTALFDTEVASTAETDAFATLGPALAGCVPPGLELKFSKFQLRGFLAEGAYRATAAQQTAGA